MNFLGDSITEGIGVEDIENCRVDNRLKKLCDLAAVNNYSVSGTRLAHQIHPTDKPHYDLCFCGPAAFGAQPLSRMKISRMEAIIRFLRSLEKFFFIV